MKRYFLAICCLLLTLNIVHAQTAEEILRKAENAVKGNSAHGVMEMIVITPDYTRKLKMESWWVGNDKSLIVIKSPKKEAGNKTLKIKNEMWNYLRNTETTIKVPPSMMLQAWNGSDFTNDDLVRDSNLNEDYTLDLLGKEDIREENCWKIELTPKPDTPVVWGKIHYWVRISDDLPAKVAYFDEKGEMVRYMDYLSYETLNGHKMPTRWVMKNNLKEGRQTEIVILDMAFNIKIKDRIFSFRELESGR